MILELSQFTCQNINAIEILCIFIIMILKTNPELTIKHVKIFISRNTNSFCAQLYLSLKSLGSGSYVLFNI